jgi:hypothetical protein
MAIKRQIALYAALPEYGSAMWENGGDIALLVTLAILILAERNGPLNTIVKWQLGDQLSQVSEPMSFGKAQEIEPRVKILNFLFQESLLKVLFLRGFAK